MGKSIKETNPSADPFLLGMDTRDKKNTTVIKKTEALQSNADPFLLGVEIKKKETATPTSSTLSAGGGIDLQEESQSQSSLVEGAISAATDFYSNRATPEEVAKGVFSFGDYRKKEYAIPANIPRAQKEVQSVLAKVYYGDVKTQDLSNLNSTGYGKEVLRQIVNKEVPELAESDIQSASTLNEAVTKINQKNRVNSANAEKVAIDFLDNKINTSIQSLSSPTKEEGGQVTEYINELRSALPSVDYNDNNSISNAISQIKKLQTVEQRNYLGQKARDNSLAQTQEVLNDLNGRLYYNISRQGISPTLNQLGNDINQAVTSKIIDSQIGESVNDPQNDAIKLNQFKLGLTAVEKSDPILFKNVVQGISQLKKVADTDFANISRIGQQIENTTRYRGGAYDPALIGTETNFDYTTFGQKKAEAAAKIGEWMKEKGYKNMNEFPEVLIRAAAKETGIENKEIVNSLVFDEKLGGYDAIPKAGWIDDIQRGIMQPLEGINSTINSWTESPAQTYQRSKELAPNVGAQKVPDAKGEYSDVLPSERGKFTTDMFRGLGQFIPQVLLTKGVGAGVRGLAGTTGVVLNTSQARNVADFGGTAISTFLQSYGPAYEEHLQKTGDSDAAALIATIDGISSSAFELLLPDVRIADKAFAGLKGQLSNNLISLIKKGGDPAELATKAKPFIQKFFKSATNTLAQENLEEIGTQYADFVTESIFDPESAKDRNLSKELWDTFKATSASMLIPSVLGAGGASLQKDFTTKTLHSAAINFDSYKESLQNSLDKGYIEQLDYNGAIQMLQTHKESIENTPEENVNGVKLSPAKKLDYALEETKVKYYKDKAKKSDGVTREMWESKIKDAEEIQRSILMPEETELETEVVSATPQGDELVTETEVITPQEESQLSEAETLVGEMADEQLIPDVYAEVAKSNPRQFLQEVYQQANNIDQDGNPLEGDVSEAIKSQFTDTLVQTANEVFPIIQKLNQNEKDSSKESGESREGSEASQQSRESGQESGRQKNVSEIQQGVDNAAPIEEVEKRRQDYLAKEGTLTKQIKQEILNGNSGLDKEELEVVKNIISSYNGNVDEVVKNFSGYVANDFKYINNILRKGAEVTKESIEKEGKSSLISDINLEEYRKMREVLDNTEFYPNKKTTLYRTLFDLGDNFLYGYSVGDTITDKGLVSTSISEDWSNNTEFPLIKYELNKGDYINGFYVGGVEKEFIINSDTDFIVVKKDFVNNRLVLTVRPKYSSELKPSKEEKGQKTKKVRITADQMQAAQPVSGETLTGQPTENRTEIVEVSDEAQPNEASIALQASYDRLSRQMIAQNEDPLADPEMQAMAARIEQLKSKSPNISREEKSTAPKKKKTKKELADRLSNILNSGPLGYSSSTTPVEIEELFDGSKETIEIVERLGQIVGDDFLNEQINSLIPYLRSNPEIKFSKMFSVGRGEAHHTGDWTVLLSEVKDAKDLASVVVHELYHIISINEIDNNPKFNDKIQSLIEDIRKKLGADKYFDGAKNTDFGVTKDQKLYGLLNPKEFIAEIFSNKEFSDLVDKALPGKSVLQRIVDFVNEALGIKPKSNSEQVRKEILKGLNTKIDFVSGEVYSQVVENYKKSYKQSDYRYRPLSLKRKDSPLTRVSFNDIGISEGDSIQQAIDKLIAYDGEFTPIFEAVKSDGNFNDLTLEMLPSLENNQSGLYYPQGGDNGGLLQIANKDNVYYTFAHELMHFLTLDSQAAESVKDSTPYKAIEDIYNFLSSQKGRPVEGQATMESYGLKDVKEFMAELLINPTFREYVSDVYAKDFDEISKQSKAVRDSGGKSFGEIILNLFKDLFSKLFSAKGEVSYDSSQSAIDNAARIATDLFFQGKDITDSQESSEGGATIVNMQDQSGKAAALGLPSGSGARMDAIVEFVRESLDEGNTIAEIQSALLGAGFTEQETNSIIDANLRPNSDAPTTSIRNSKVAEKRSAFGAGTPLVKDVKTNNSLLEDAAKRIEEGYDVDELIDEIFANPRPISDLENAILLQYQREKEVEIAKVNVAIEKAAEDGDNDKMKRLADKRTDLVDQLTWAYDASERAGTEQGRALQSRKMEVFEDTSLANLLVRKSSANNGVRLTPDQIAEVTEQYEEIQRTKKTYEDKIRVLEEKNAQLKAENKIKSAVREQKSAKRSQKAADIKKDIAASFQELKKIAKDQRGKLSANPIPVEMLPVIAKITKDLVRLGINTLDGVVDNIYQELKDVVDGVSKRDVRDAISGYGYPTEGKTKSDLQRDLNELKSEAKYMSQLEDILDGKPPANERDRRDRSQKIKELQAKIKTAVNTSDAARLKSFKARTEQSIKDVEERIKNKQFEAKPTPPLELDEEALKLKRAYRRSKEDFELSLYRDQLSKRSKLKKVGDGLMDLLGSARTLITSFDFSAPLRQGIVASVSHPKIAGKAFIEMFRQAFSKQRFDDWLGDLKETKEYELMRDSGLYISDPNIPFLSAKEESFMGNLVKKIPVVGQLIGVSERAYISYLNKLRADLFNSGVEQLEESGYTFKENKDVYKALATLINNSTGRGGLGKAEPAAQLLNTVFFSPRLMASRFNMLNPVWYAKMPPPIRKKAISDFGKFVGFGTALLTAVSLGSGDDEDDAKVGTDPRSTDFGKIKIGDKRIDIWGGFQPFVRLFSQLASGESVSSTTGKVNDLYDAEFGKKTGLDQTFNFFRSKLAPVPSSIVNLLAGKDIVGQPANIQTEALKQIIPLYLKDVAETVKEEGPLGALTTGIPAMFGVGVQSYGGAENIKPLGNLKVKEWKFLADKGIDLPTVGRNQVKVTDENTGDKRNLTDSEYKEFATKRANLIKQQVGEIMDKEAVITKGGEEVTVKVKDMPIDVLKLQLKKIYTKATQEVKKEMFGDQKSEPIKITIQE